MTDLFEGKPGVGFGHQTAVTAPKEDGRPGRVLIIESDHGLSVDALLRLADAGFEVGASEPIDEPRARGVVLLAGGDEISHLSRAAAWRMGQGGRDVLVIDHASDQRRELPAILDRMSFKTLMLPSADADYTGPPRNRRERRAAKRTDRGQES